MAQIEKFQKDSTTRTALHTDPINELVHESNKWDALKFSPEGIAKMEDSDGVRTITINCPSSAGTPSGDTMIFRVSVEGSAENVEIPAEIV